MKINIVGQDNAPLGSEQHPHISNSGMSSRPSSAKERALAALMGNKEAPVVADSTPVEPTLAPEEIVPSTAVGEKEAPVAPEAKPLEESLARKYADLAKREKEFRQRELALRQKEKSLKPAEEVKEAKPAFDPSTYISKEELLKNPFQVMNQLGLTYDQLTEMALNGPSQEQMILQNEVAALRAELNNIKSDTENSKKAMEEREKSQYTQAIAQFKSEVERLITNNTAYELTSAEGRADDVVELVERTYREDGILMTVEDAAQQVEEYLVTEALRVAKLNKIQQMLTPKAEATPTKTTETKPTQIKTLTNLNSSSRPLSNKERAMLVLRGEKI